MGIRAASTLFGVVLLAGLLQLAGAPLATAAPGTTTTFSSVGTGQDYQVPAGANTIAVVAYGAQGGSGGGSGSSGGSGAVVHVSQLAVTPGEHLTIDVGGKGQNGGTGTTQTAGGTNGGGTGGAWTSTSNGNGGGGGGATDVKRGSTLLLIAGGGGGGGGDTSSGAGGIGGVSRSNFDFSMDGGTPNRFAEGGGLGATQSFGGSHGVSDNNNAFVGACTPSATDGSLRQGGAGAGCVYGGGGGGGGGLYGGGGGGGSANGLASTEAGCGGGGGSSSGPSGTTYEVGAHSGDGLVTIIVGDTDAPTVSLADIGTLGLTNDNTPTFTGNRGTAANDIATVTVNVYQGTDTSGTLVHTLTTSSGGSTYSVEDTNGLGDGTYTAVATQSDESGNLGTSLTRTFTVDTTAPTVSLDAPADASSTNDSTPTISGTAETAAGNSSNVTVRIYDGAGTGGTEFESFTLSRDAGTGAYSGDTPTPLAPEGQYTVQAEQHDSAGNIGYSAANTITFDTTAPVPTISNPGDGDTTNGTPHISGGVGTATGDDTTETVTIYPGSTPSGTPTEQFSGGQNAPGQFSLPVTTPLISGQYTVQVTQSDAAGNTGNSASHTFTVDADAPAFTTFTHPPRRTRSKTARFTFDTTDSNGPAAYSCQLDRKLPASCTSPKVYRRLKPGKHTLVVTATDLYSNSSTETWTWRVLR